MHSNWQYLKRGQVNTSKWDECISTSGNGRVYALAEYLDHTSQHWDALVYGDYEIVIPLPWKKKFGIQYVYAPPFIQHLGIFGSSANAEIATEGIKLASRRFRWIDYNVNDSFADIPGRINFKTNYILDLNRSYEEIRAGYSIQCVTNLRKATARGCMFEEMLPVPEVVRLFRSAYGSRHSTHDREYNGFEMLLNNPRQFKVHGYGVREKETDEVIFGALVIEFRDRLYYAMAAPTEKGRNARATYFFIDQVIQRFAGSNRSFDFEGSELPNVAEFYKRFGPSTEQYLHLTINNLPWFVRMFKS